MRVFPRIKAARCARAAASTLRAVSDPNRIWHRDCPCRKVDQLARFPATPDRPHPDARRGLRIAAPVDQRHLAPTRLLNTEHVREGKAASPRRSPAASALLTLRIQPRFILDFCTIGHRGPGQADVSSCARHRTFGPPGMGGDPGWRASRGDINGGRPAAW